MSENGRAEYNAWVSNKHHRHPASTRAFDARAEYWAVKVLAPGFFTTAVRSSRREVARLSAKIAK